MSSTTNRARSPDSRDESHAEHLERLRAELKYLGRRRDLYRAQVYGPRPARLSRLRELEREYELADAYLRRAERD